MSAARLFTISTSAKALARLRNHCLDIGLPAPGCWQHQHLHRSLRDLVTSGEDFAPPDDFNATLRLTALKEPLILFCNVPPEQVQRMVKAYKQEGEWPVFAVVTKNSLEMTLAVLLEHLLQDRGVEAAAKDKRP